MPLRNFDSIFGVDFSGAKLAGQNIWIARTEPTGAAVPLRLMDLHNLQVLAGTAEREPALAHLAGMIRQSTAALWGLDFPFALPIEIFPAGTTWLDQLRFVLDWKTGAYDFGLWCVGQARALGGPIHIRRTTDTETKTPFDCYHYRIIYQTFHGMRDVLAPLASLGRTAVLPFQYGKLRNADRVVTEACPGSVLKRLGLPHQNYKQAAGGVLTAKRRRTRRVVLDGMDGQIEMSAGFRSRMMRNPGGDAMDAVIAAVGAWQTWQSADHRSIRRHPRYRFEGRVYS